MGSGFSSLLSPCCFKATHPPPQPDSPPILDETLGHSFCYLPSTSNRFISPTNSDRFISPSHSLRFSPTRTNPALLPASSAPATAAPHPFRAISGASVSANSNTPTSIIQLHQIHDDATAITASASSVNNVSGFESTASFSALPLQRVPRGGEGFFMSGPIGAFSGPLLDPGVVDGASGGGGDGSGGRVPFSAPLGGAYAKRSRRKVISEIKKAIYRNISSDKKKKKKPWVVPVLNFVNRRENSGAGGLEERERVLNREEDESNGNVQWALGKAGEDRVHVVVSEEHGWLFVGIYDGFNGPDAPEFLMGNLYRAVFNQLQGLFWELEETDQLGQQVAASEIEQHDADKDDPSVDTRQGNLEMIGSVELDMVAEQDRAKRVTFGTEDRERVEISTHRRRLWEFLAEDDAEDGLDLSGSDRFAFSVDDAISLGGDAGSAVSRRWLLLSKLKQGLSKQRDRKLFPWRFGLEGKEMVVEEKVVEVEEESSRVEEREVSKRKRKVGPIDHDLVLNALSRALEMVELAYLDMTDKVLDANPELALMGSCLLVALMRDEDVYVMNVGDSRAIVAQYEPQEVGSSGKDDEVSTEGIVEGPAQPMRLTALQLSTDHSTSIEEEVMRIKNEHPDDSQCIVNDRVKGRLKVTRAFGAGFLKQPKLNDALLEMFRNEYIGTAPYLSCSPSLRHHHLCPRDQFLVLSSDGLYQYLSNQEVVSHVESFMEKFPDGDPAQHLIEELLSRAAKKAGMDFHELLDIPQGDRRKYHDDVTVMVISLEGRIWKSSGKYL